jgi:hypothetical protein
VSMKQLAKVMWRRREQRLMNRDAEENKEA